MRRGLTCSPFAVFPNAGDRPSGALMAHQAEGYTPLDRLENVFAECAEELTLCGALQGVGFDDAWLWIADMPAARRRRTLAHLRALFMLRGYDHMRDGAELRAELGNAQALAGSFQLTADFDADLLEVRRRLHLDKTEQRPMPWLSSQGDREQLLRRVLMAPRLTTGTPLLRMQVHDWEEGALDDWAEMLGAGPERIRTEVFAWHGPTRVLRQWLRVRERIVGVEAFQSEVSSTAYQGGSSRPQQAVSVTRLTPEGIIPLEETALWARRCRHRWALGRTWVGALGCMAEQCTECEVTRRRVFLHQLPEADPDMQAYMESSEYLTAMQALDTLRNRRLVSDLTALRARDGVREPAPVVALLGSGRADLCSVLFNED